MNGPRLFLALWPSLATRAAIALHVKTWQWPPDAVLYAEADWHLTLHFLGTMAPAQVAELQAALHHMPAQPQPLNFLLPTGHAQCWPHGLAVLCPDELPPALLQLHSDLGQVLQSLGLPTDTRPFRPHITLARRAQGAVPPVQPCALNWLVSGFALVESTGDAQARYRVLQHI